MPTQFVSINREAVKAAIKARILAAIEARPDSVQHYNHDAEFSPSEWWNDTAMTDRRTLTTTATMSVDGDTVAIHLTYTF